jgi:hypothetical protein
MFNAKNELKSMDISSSVVLLASISTLNKMITITKKGSPVHVVPACAGLTTLICCLFRAHHWQLLNPDFQT